MVGQSLTQAAPPRGVPQVAHDDIPTGEGSVVIDSELPVAVRAALIEHVLRWADSARADALPAAWVPGADDRERSRLRALGWLVRWRLDSIADAWASAWNLPSDVRTWLAAPDSSLPADVTQAFARLIADGPTSVAAIYSTAVHSVSRRRLGTFFTPTSEAEWMISRWAQTEGAPGSVVDVGAGVGVFTLKAAAAWPDADLYPVDVNPVTLGLLLVLVPEEEQPRSHILPVLGDYVAWLSDGWTGLDGGRLVLGNPPYTRLQLIPSEQRATLLQAAGDLCGSRASLSALMLAASLRQLAPDDGVCLLLPAQWLEADYARGLRAWLWAQRSRRVELHLFGSGLFPDAQVDAVALLVGRQKEDHQPFALSTAHSPRDAAPIDARTLERSSDCPDNWRRLFDEPSPIPSQPSPRHLQAGSVLLGDVAAPYRGVATGANWFFALSEEERLDWNLGEQDLVPYLQRTRRHSEAIDVTREDLKALPISTKRYLLVSGSGNEDHSAFRAYVAYGLKKNANVSYLCRTRADWWDLRNEVKIPDAIIGAAATSRFAVLANRAAAAITNNLYGLSWTADLNVDEQSELLEWLRSDAGQSELWRRARTQAGGLRKLEVRALAELRVPASILR